MSDWIDAPIERPGEYYRFFELFNARDFFEAHEVLEDLWVIEVGAVRDYYKGLIMAAVAIEHWRRANCSGARKLWRDASVYLRAYPATYEGFELRGFIHDMDALFAPIRAGGANVPAPADEDLPVLSVQRVVDAP